MALIRVTRSRNDGGDDEIILNTGQIILAYEDSAKRGSWVQMAHCEPVLVKLSFEELWMLIQRET